jgi:hypothetical protein
MIWRWRGGAWFHIHPRQAFLGPIFAGELIGLDIEVVAMLISAVPINSIGSIAVVGTEEMCFLAGNPPP